MIVFQTIIVIVFTAIMTQRVREQQDEYEAEQ